MTLALLTQRVNDSVGDITSLKNDLAVIADDMTTQHARLTAQVTALRMTMTRYVGVAIGVLAILQMVLLPLALKYGEKLLK